MGENLATRTIGTPDSAYAWYLHTSGGTLSSGGTGIIISNGAGTDTGLKVWSDSIGIQNGTSYHRIKTLASIARDVSIADNDGTLHPKVVKKILVESTTADSGIFFTDNTISFSGGRNGYYRIHLLLIVQSASAANGVKVRVQGGTEVVMAHLHFNAPAATRTALAGAAPSGLPATYTAADSPDGSPFLVEVTGIFRINGPETSGVQVTYSTENTGTNVYLKAGSLAIYEWLSD